VLLAFWNDLVIITPDMTILTKKITPAVAAILLFLAGSLGFTPVNAQTDTLDELFIQLAQPVDGDWQSVEARIWKEWSHSGSAAMDLLLERGRAETKARHFDKAIEHLTALTDHAPDFAEGWNARATAFFMMGEYGLSLMDIQRTLALNPRHFGAMSGLGRIMEQLDHPKDALKAYSEALAVHPHSPNLKRSVERLKKKVGGTSL